MTYRPNPENLDAKLISFFALNPDEELTLDDVIEKFVTPGDTRNVHSQLTRACDHEYLTWDRDASVFRGGTVLPPSVLADPEAPTKPGIPTLPISLAPGERWGSLKPATRNESRPAPAKAKPMTRKPIPPKINLMTIPIEDGIEIPAIGYEWTDFLAKFKPGQSAALPLSTLVRLRSATKTARETGRGTFVVRTMADGETVRVWRTE